MEFNYSLYPGKERKQINYEKKEIEPKITIVTAYYNGHKYIDETVNSVLNQTFPFWEWIIVNDGSTDEESIKKLEEIKKIDKRIKIINKENSGPGDSRDLGAKNSSKTSNYLLFLDSDDLLKNTYLECAYITLETNKNAAWAYCDTVNFGEQDFLWRKKFSTEIEKKENLLVLTALIRKEAFFEVNGFNVTEVDFFEDWYLWLKLLDKKMYPVRINELGFWYRKKKTDESKLAKDLLKAKEIIKRMQEEFKNIPNSIKAIQYPKQDYNWDILEEIKIDILHKEKDNKKHVLLIFPWLALGGADKFNLDFIKGLSKKDYEFTIIITEPNINVWRQQFEEYATIYDLTTFLDRKYWPSFINYIMKKENIDLIMNSNSTFGYAAIPYIKSCNPEVPIIDYIHMEEWYNRNGGFSRDTANLEKILEKTLVCNENSKKILVEHFGRNKETVETVYIGVDSEKFNPSKFNKKEILKKYKINSEGKKIIGFIARIDLQKRPYLLMKIIKKLKEKREDFIVLVVGDGPLLPSIKRKTKKYNLEKNVIFIGPISNTAEIYAMCDITLNCSIKEGLALTSYESLSMGVPVISANVGGQAELISDDVGAIVPCLQKEEDILNYKYSDEEIENYVDAINKIFNNLDYYKKNARQIILNKFTIEKMIEKMGAILNNIISNYNINDLSIEKYKEIFKEIITRYYMLHAEEYDWLCRENNKILFGEEIIETDEINEAHEIHNKNKLEKMKRKIIRFTVKLHIYNESKIIYRIVLKIKDIIKLLIQLIKQIFKHIFRIGGKNE